MKNQIIIGAAAAILFSMMFFARPATANGCTGESNQMEMNDCSYQDYKDADKQLNATYNKLVSLVAAHGKKFKAKLVASQKAWMAFRDKECDFAAALNQGGSIYPLLYNSCMTDLTSKRTEELKQHIEIYK